MTHSTAYFGICPVCRGGGVGAWICGGCDSALVMCEECDAMWPNPASNEAPLYPELNQSACPCCEAPLYQTSSHWADRDRVEMLGWSQHLMEQKETED